MNRVVRYIGVLVLITALCAVVGVLFVTPYMVNDGYNLSATLYLGKVTWVVVAASLIVAIINRRFFSVGWSDIMVVALALLLYLNSDSLGLYKEQVILLLSIYFAMRLLFSVVDLAKYLFPIIVCGVVAAQLYIAYMQLFTGMSSNHALFAFTGSFENPGPLCGFVAMLLPVAIAISMHNFDSVSNSRYVRVLLSALKYVVSFIAIVGGAIVLAGGSRTALVALVAGCLILFANRAMFNRLQGWFSVNRKLGVAIIFVFVVFFVVAAYLLFMVKADSAFGRLLLWRTSLSAMLDNPFWGVGLGKFTSCYGEVQAGVLAGMEPADMWVRVADVPQFAFNEFLHFGVEGGVVAMVLLFGIFVYTIYSSLKCGTLNGRVYGACLSALMIFAMASYPLRVLPFVTVATVLVVAAVSEFEKGICRYYDRAVFGIALLVCSIMVWKNPHYSNKELSDWSSERRYYNMDIFKTTVDNYGKLLPAFSDNYAFLIEYGRASAETKQ